MTDPIVLLAKAAGIKKQSADRWEKLSAEVIAARLGGDPTAVNSELEKEAGILEGHLLSVAYRAWFATNLVLVGQYDQAAKLFDKLIRDAHEYREGPLPFDPVVSLLRHRAATLRLTRNSKLAITGAIDLATTTNCSHPLFALQVARTAEEFGANAKAEKWYERTLAATEDAEGVNYRVRSTVEDTPAYIREAARRDLKRLKSEPDLLQSPQTLAQAVADAIVEKDYKALNRLSSITHFSISVGCHSVYVAVDDTLDRLYKALDSALFGPFVLENKGDHHQLCLGASEAGHPLRYARFILKKCTRGWQWTGIQVSNPQYWLPDFPSAPLEKNQALAIRIKGPWLAGRKFMAGGIRNPWHGFNAMAADPFTLGLRACSSECGFGWRGLYYNEAISHNGFSAFAIDFTSYEQCVPFSDRTNLWPVLAPADGLVLGIESSFPNGSDSKNVVELIHPTVSPPCQYLSRYLHLAGPAAIPVSEGMFVRTGTVLGFMDDTGNSTMPHLHFSIHDQSMGPHPDMVTSSVSAPIMFGPSVRATPMAGQRLDDGDDGRCVDSRNTGVLPVVRVR